MKFESMIEDAQNYVSPSARRVWIEIRQWLETGANGEVTLRKEGVD